MARTKQPRGVLVIHDRYSAVGKPRPDPKTMCKGPCEGMGFYPKRVEAKYIFVKCPDCKGTGRAAGKEST